ncbi:putative candidate secreted effector protein [Blumeria hordei DH14]|uniref:Putative candidate secreted effector protein n=1 Tax=Blumeria graminis f. sp. hordei (strain DH14) TaxID=546991 RepID=N1JJR4_BLUG1|nr:putative candidate secreted effector protein [Blumeria hordei DH14]
MKFFSSASTAALACLLSLVPAVLGGSHFRCGNQQKFTMTKLRLKISSFAVSNARADDPLHPRGSFCPTYRFTRKPRGGVHTEYLFQLIDRTPTFRVFEKQTTEFFPCLFILH